MIPFEDGSVKLHCAVLQLSYATKHVEQINGARSSESPADSLQYTGKV